MGVSLDVAVRQRSVCLTPASGFSRFAYDLTRPEPGPVPSRDQPAANGGRPPCRSGSPDSCSARGRQPRHQLRMLFPQFLRQMPAERLQVQADPGRFVPPCIKVDR
jgi:hypothetical protein